MKDENVTLEKKLSPLNVWSLALGCIIGWGAFVMPGNTFLGKAGPLGTAIAMCIAALIMIIIAFNYNFMINKYPVAGGEFTLPIPSRHSGGSMPLFVLGFWVYHTLPSYR